MKIIKLCLDFLNGPIWKDVYDVKSDTLITGVHVIDTDSVLQELDKTAQEMYSSFYSFGKKGEECRFNEDSFHDSKETLSSLIERIKKRLNEINDGTFVVEDYISIKKEME